MRYILAFTDHSQLDIYLKDISVIQKNKVDSNNQKNIIFNQKMYIQKEDIERIYYHFTKKIF